MENSAEIQRVRDAYVSRPVRLLNADRTPSDLANLIWPVSHVTSVIINQIDHLKLCLDSFRPLIEVHEKLLDETFEVEFIHELNQIKGNALSLQETSIVLEYATTFEDKLLTDQIAVFQVHKALVYIKYLARCQIEITAAAIYKINRILKCDIDNNNDGIPRIYECLEWYYDVKETEHPVMLASEFCERITKLNQSADVRVSWIVANYLLIKHGFPLTTIFNLKRKYGDENELRLVIISAIKHSLLRYLDAVSASVEKDCRGNEFFNAVSTFMKV